MCIAVEAGLEKRRYLLFASPGAAKSFSIRCVFHGAGASRRNCDAQKAYCFQHGLNCNKSHRPNLHIEKNALPLTCVFGYNRTVAQNMPGRTREEGAGAGVFQSCQKRSILISCPGRGSQIRGTYIWLQLRPPGHTLLWRKTGIQSCAFGRITCSACKTSAAAATALPL